MGIIHVERINMNLFGEYYLVGEWQYHRSAYPRGISDDLMLIETPKTSDYFLVQFPGFREYCEETIEKVWIYIYGAKEDRSRVEDWAEIDIVRRLFPKDRRYSRVANILFTDLIEKLNKIIKDQQCDTSRLHVSHSLEELVEEIKKIEKSHLQPRMLYLRYSLNYPHIIKLREKLNDYIEQNKNQDAESLLVFLSPKTYGLNDFLVGR